MSSSLAVAALLCLSAPGAEPADERGARCAECLGLDGPRWPVKGGLASIADGIYVTVKTGTNEVIIQGLSGADVTWTGKASDQPEVVVIFGRQVLEWSRLPADWDLSRAILVSFERDRVRFFDFAKATGGFYPRADVAGRGLAGLRPSEVVDAAARPLPPEAFEAIDPTMTARRIMQQLGPAQRQRGSGLCIYVWQVTDGREFVVGTTCDLGRPPVYARFL